MALRQSENKQRSDKDSKGKTRRKGGKQGGRQIEMNTHTNTKGSERKGKRQELTGFDVEGHRVSAVLAGGIAESSDVRSDIDTDHTLNARLSLLFRCRLEDLARRKERQRKANAPCHRLKKGAAGDLYSVRKHSKNKSTEVSDVEDITHVGAELRVMPAAL